MTVAKTICLAIPVLNGGRYLEKQWDSFIQSGLLNLVDEIIYVDDGSSDDTADILNAISRSAPIPVAVINNKRTCGRFLARLEGAKASSASHILFLDSRLTLSAEFARAFSSLRNEADCLMGHVDIDTDRSVFCLYWDRTHRVIFHKHFEETRNRVVMTSENVGMYLKGTTVFFTKTDVFVKVCSKYELNPLLNDDTVVIEEIAAITPLVLDPSWRINWVPRETFFTFLGRMWERGPSFVEYHVFTKRGKFFWAVLAGLALMVLLIYLLVAHFTIGIASLVFGLFVISLSTAVFSRNMREFVWMVPLHVSTILSFGFGILWGLIVNISKLTLRSCAKVSN